MMKTGRISFMVMACGFLAVIGCGGSPHQTVVVEQTTVEEADVPDVTSGPAIIDHTVQSLTGDPVDLATYRGKPMLLVNTASKCGYTPQYAGLQELHEKYGERGLVVIGFPSNDFGNQEPGSADEIASFCSVNYGVTFPMMAKVHTKGPDQAPIYRTLTAETDQDIRGAIRWNFTKFLVDPEGRVAARFESAVEPLDEKVTSAIEAMLGDPGVES